MKKKNTKYSQMMSSGNGSDLMTAIPLHIECLGGPSDGKTLEIDCQKESIMVPDESGKKAKYSDTGKLNDKGRIVYRCASGPGKVKEDFADRYPGPGQV